MALIIVTGLPFSGKSTLSQKILTHLQGKQNPDLKIRIVSDSDVLDFDGRNDIYKSIVKEKELRGWLRSEAQRYLNLNQVVILDSAAYIKGFRYELYCMTKEAKGRYCVVEKLIDPDTCWKWIEEANNKCSDSKSNEDSPELYTRETFDALVLRYEKCDENNRWDSPLFKLTSEDEQLNMEELYEIITSEQALVPNKCTTTTSARPTLFKN